MATVPGAVGLKWSRRGLWRLCAAIVVLLLGFSLLHAATPHNFGQRDCATCKALSSPGVADGSESATRPSEVSFRAPAPAPPAPPSRGARYLRPLRAPPAS